MSAGFMFSGIWGSGTGFRFRQMGRLLGCSLPCTYFLQAAKRRELDFMSETAL